MPVKEVHGSGEGLDPEGWGHVGLKQHGANNVISGANGMLGLAILLGSMRTRKPKKNPMLTKEININVIDEFAPVVRLKGANGGLKLVLHISDKSN